MWDHLLSIEEVSMKIWYQRPASQWNEALPIGNGHIGSMIYGTPVRDCVQLNDETIWYRGKTDRNNPDSFENLSKIRKLILEGKVEEAEELVKLTMFATPRDQSHYELLGELYIEHTNLEVEDVIDYRRELDLDTAISSVEFLSNKTGVRYNRQYFTSFSDNVLICKISSSKSKMLQLKINLGRKKRFNDGVSKIGTSGICMYGSAGGKNGTRFKVICSAQTDEGTVSVLGETLLVTDATEVILVLRSLSNYWDPDNWEEIEDLQPSVSITRHITSYQKQFKRIEFLLSYSKASEIIPTDRLLVDYKNHEQYLTTLMFHYGRYLLISSSQPGGLPSNLQGIWCDEINPIWGSKYTININTQMNYWMVGPCNMAEVEYPLFEMLARMMEQGSETAKKMYGLEGFTAHHNTDGFGDTAPQSHAIGAAIWVMTVPWLCTHIWEHYQYFRDISIVEKYFNLVKEAFKFIEGYLFEVDGKLLTGPTVSPENSYFLPNGKTASICLSSTIDNQILRYFFDSCIKMNLLLGGEIDFENRIKQLKHKLPLTKIGKYGQIQEWLEDYDEVEQGHRHISPLFGLYPYDEIDIVKTPELANGARITIQRRLKNTSFLDCDNREQVITDWLDGGLHENTQTGWSAAWLIHFFARLQEGEEARKMILELFRTATLGNLFMDHPPFQIDGNLGLVSGICELLVQSHREEIDILPALPLEWTTGIIKDIRVRGGYNLHIEWSNCKIDKLFIYGGCPGEEVKINVYNRCLGSKEQIILKFDSNGTAQFKQ